MDRKPDMNAHLAAKKRQYVKRKKRLRTVIILLSIALLLALWVGIAAVAYRSARGSDMFTDLKNALAEKLIRPAQTEVVTTAPETKPVTVLPEPERSFVQITLPNTDIHQGDLILISTLLGYEYTFPEDVEICTLHGNKSKSYRISTTRLSLNRTTLDALNTMFDAYFAQTGNGDYQITQGYRTFEEQKEIYDDYQEVYGKEQGALLAAYPGFSEHHSGYAFDMNVYTADGISYSLGTASEHNPDYGWIYDHAAEYGFVLRYPAEKTQVTGITNEPWHFRYVGRGHAAYMTANALTLEEYIGLLYRYPADGEHLAFQYDGADYEVYFCPVNAEGETTTIPVPSDAPYTVSGDNVNGFIVTVTN